MTGRIDHMAADLARHRLFVAELGNDTIGVVDFDAQKVIHRIDGLKEDDCPQGVVALAQLAWKPPVADRPVQFANLSYKLERDDN